MKCLYSVNKNKSVLINKINEYYNLLLKSFPFYLCDEPTENKNRIELNHYKN